MPQNEPNGRFLPSLEELESFIRDHGEQLRQYILRLCGKRFQSETDDIFQIVCAELTKKIQAGKPFVKKWPAYVYFLAKHRVEDMKRGYEAIAMSQLAQQIDDDAGPSLDVADIDLTGSPHEALERERTERKKGILSELLQEYFHYRESQQRMWRGREIAERTLRGETSHDVAQALRMAPGTVQTQQSRIIGEIIERLQKHDAAMTVFRTIWNNEPSDKTNGRKNRRNYGDPLYLRNAEDLYRYLVEESGALCPLPERLAQYAQDPTNEKLSYVRYHLVKCRLCGILLGQLNLGWSKSA